MVADNIDRILGPVLLVLVVSAMTLGIWLGGSDLIFGVKGLILASGIMGFVVTAVLVRGTVTQIQHWRESESHPDSEPNNRPVVAVEPPTDYSREQTLVIDKNLGELVLDCTGKNADEQSEIFEKFMADAEGDSDYEVYSRFIQALARRLDWLRSFTQEELRESNRLLDAALELAPSSQVIRIERAYGALSEGDTFGAENFLTTGANDSIWYPRYHTVRGHLETLNLRFEEAERANREACHLAPNRVSTLLGYAHALLKLGRVPEAEVSFSRLLGQHPGNHQAMLGIAVVHTMGKDMEAALLLVDQLRESTVSTPALQLGMEIALAERDGTLAEKYLEMLKGADPNTLEISDYQNAVNALPTAANALDNAAKALTDEKVRDWKNLVKARANKDSYGPLGPLIQFAVEPGRTGGGSNGV